MNKSVIKYNKIVCVSGKFSGSVTTVQEDIVVMLTHKQKQPKRKTRDDENHNPIKTLQRDPPSFITHYKSAKGKKYKLGNTLDHKGVTFHYCNCPLHYNELKWHTHTPDQCGVCSRWLKGKYSSPPPPSIDTDAVANISEENKAYGAGNQTYDGTSTTSSSKPTQDVQALLATAMSLVPDNDVIKNFI